MSHDSPQSRPVSSKKKLAPIGQSDEASTAEESKVDGGTFIEEGLDDKLYMIKSSGTIVDVTKQKEGKKKSRKIPMSVKKPTSANVYLLSS